MRSPIFVRAMTCRTKRQPLRVPRALDGVTGRLRASRAERARLTSHPHPFRQAPSWPSKIAICTPATFSTGDGPTWLMVVRAFREPDGAWAVDPIGGGAGRGPNRSRPWVNFTARGGRRNDFAGGGEVIGEDFRLAPPKCYAFRRTDQPYCSPRRA